jgi:hypothetical protein
MNQPAHSSGEVAQSSFFYFIFRDKSNRLFFFTGIIAVILQFVIFKYLYPYADFFSDSYSYIYAAYAHLDINIWPIGYSKFLLFFHGLTSSDTAVVAFQYFFLELSGFYFFFTLLYFYRPSWNISLILFLFLFFNPLFLYISNYINSDPLFAALSLLWFSELLWILQRPRPYQIFTQAILLFLAFTIRNNAMYYPFISVIVFILSRQRAYVKWVGSLLGITFIVLFVLFSQAAAFRMTGTRQFSLFTGWQLANNALYMYGNIQVDSNQLPASCRELDRLSKNFYQEAKPSFNDDYLAGYVANYFIRQPNAPLKQYLVQYYPSTNEYSDIISWGKASPVFASYGLWLIEHYPLHFARYYLLVNTKNYFLPPLEKLEVYNQGRDFVADIAPFWFNYKSTAVKSFSKTLQGNILFLYPLLFLLVQLYLGWKMIEWFVRRKKQQASSEYDRAFLLAASFTAANFCFCVFATIIVLRYQFFPTIVSLAFALLLMDMKKTSKPYSHA